MASLSHLSGVRKARSRQPQMPRIKRAASAFRRAHARAGDPGLSFARSSHLGSGAKLRQVACSIKQSSENRPRIHFLESGGPSSSVPALAIGKASPYAL